MIRGRDGSREHRRLGDKVFQNPEQRKRTRMFYNHLHVLKQKLSQFVIIQKLDVFFFSTLRLIAKLILLQSDIAVKSKVAALYSI